jgi:hypothetical protein
MAKTITEKLNLQKYEKKAVLKVPEGSDYLSDLTNYDIEIIESSYDLIFAFVLDLDSLKGVLHEVIEKNTLNKGGYIYFAYPKKGNKVYPTFIHRDDLLSGIGADEKGYVGTSNIKFSRMVGLDEVFTVVGLKEDSPGKTQTSTRASQCVDEYEALIPDVERDLQDTPDLLAFYQSLTPGYKKDWARYIYSAKQEATKQKRRDEMKVILGEGYKTRDLYRSRK